MRPYTGSRLVPPGHRLIRPCRGLFPSSCPVLYQEKRDQEVEEKEEEEEEEEEEEIFVVD
jgi:hypothetical protein